MEQLQRLPSPTLELVRLKEQGLTFTDCIRVFAAEPTNPFRAAAIHQCSGDDDISIDESTVVSQSDSGAYVLAWCWVANSAAGFITNADLWESIWLYASTRLDELPENVGPASGTLHAQVEWLGDLVGKNANIVDGIDVITSMARPGKTAWRDPRGNIDRFLPSEALQQCLSLAREAGIDPDLAVKAQSFLLRYAPKLDVSFRLNPAD